MIKLKRFFEGDRRTVKAKKNILYSFAFKFIDAIVYFLIVPVTLGFLDKYSYGIWLTLNSILLWINTFDAGLGNGMRNCLTVSLARGEERKSRIYISTTYLLLSMISCTVFLLFLIACAFIDWYSVLNIDSSLVPNLSEVIIYSFFFFCLSFIFKIIGNIYLALQLPSVNFFFIAAGHLLSLLIILLLRLICSEGSLLWVGIAYSASPCIVYLIASIITFGILHKDLRPSFKLIKMKDYSYELMNVGINFFIIQISALVLFSMSNVVISRLFGPGHVTIFNITNRYMGIALMALNIIMAPIWSAVTDAHARGDEQWIKDCVSKVRRMALMFGVVLLLMLAISPIAFHLWVGNAVTIPFDLSALMCIYTFVLIFSASQSSFLNGLTIMKLQLWTNVVETILFLPLAYFFGSLWGLNGMVIAMIITNMPALFFNTIQVTKIKNHTAKGIWMK